MEEPDYDDLIEDYLEEFDEGPPPPPGSQHAVMEEEYDEDFLAEVEASIAAEEGKNGVGGGSNNNNTAVSSSVSQEEIQDELNDDDPRKSPISRNLGGRLATAVSPAATTPGAAAAAANNSNNREDSTTTTLPEDGSPAAQIRRELATVRSREGSTSNDIYSFERYNRNAAWRQDNQSSPSTMRAREWKTKTSYISAMTAANRSNNNQAAAKTTTPEAQLLRYYNASNPIHRARGGGGEKVIRISRTDENMSLQPTEGQDSIMMTLGDGNRVFVRQSSSSSSSSSNDTRNRLSPATTSNNTYSLGISITDLIRRVQAMRRKKEHDQLKTLSKKLKHQRKNLTSNNSGEEEDDDEEEAMEVEQEEEEEKDPSRTQTDDQLWVDKHAPSTFANLLSDERTNREVLRALRQWDPYVFKKDPPPRPKFGFQSREEEEVQATIPHDKRPNEKNRVILLSGNPGVGKTTLAHIIAAHCGYRPLEVNGSDERSATALTDRVVRAMETATMNMSKAKSGSNNKDWKGRPNCIILDEIDGADAKQALKALVELIRQEMPNNNNNKNNNKDGENKRRTANKRYLQRPIIFICNNLYAPALRPLVPYARVFQVEAPAAPRLVARLRAVLSAEGLSLWGGSRLLHDLVTASGGDIRSCLYTLQFAAAQVHRQQEEQRQQLQDKRGIDISKTLQSSLNGDGLKDDRTDIAGTTNVVFRKIKKKGNERFLWGTKQEKDPRSSVERVLDAVENFGEYGKILDCIYLNLMNVSYIDPTFDRAAAALQWLSGADNRSLQHMFTPCVAAAIHLLCRVEQKPDLTYTTRQLTDNRYELESNLGLTHKFSEGLSVKYRGSRAPDAMVNDTIPYALWMLSAGDGSSALARPATSVEVLTKLEKVAFQSHAATLRALGLSYVASREDQNGSYQNRDPRESRIMILEPPIDRLVQFQDFGHTQSSIRKEIPPSMKELLAHHASLQGIRECKTNRDEEQQRPQQKLLDSKTPHKQQQVTTKATTDTGSKPLQSTTKENQILKPSIADNSAPSKPLVNPQSSGPDAASGETTQSTGQDGGDDPTTNDKDKDEPMNKNKAKEQVKGQPPVKRQKTTSSVSASKNFLAAAGAKRRRRTKNNNVSLVRKTSDKKSNTGSGVPFQQVLRLKYVKGFTQAVRNPCRLEDLA